MAGDVNFETGEITELILPTPSKAYEDANKLQSLEERGDALKRILDTNNASRPKGAIIAISSDSNMKCHDIHMCNQVLKGACNKKPIDSFDEKFMRLTFFQWSIEVCKSTHMYFLYPFFSYY